MILKYESVQQNWCMNAQIATIQIVPPPSKEQVALLVAELTLSWC